MSDRVVLLSVPGLRNQDLAEMPHLRGLASVGETATIVPSFPCVTCPVQANMTTGRLPVDHGVVANGFYWREKREVEMWTGWNELITSPQIWDVLHDQRPGTTSAVWFPLHSKGCGADYVCTPAPKHLPNGSESLWCYTKPESLYEELLPTLDHFPLHHFWGPLANIHGSQWIADSAIEAARRYTPDFFYIYLPQLDYAAQRDGPNSEMARIAAAQLDEVIGQLVSSLNDAYGDPRPLWLIASEYVIVPVDHVLYPNRMLRAAGLLEIREAQGRELLDFENSRAWAMVDHQFSNVFVRDADPDVTKQVADLFRDSEGVAEVLIGDERRIYEMDHPRSGEVILISTANSWQAYYWWEDDTRAPEFARKVDIHQKPGYDPAEMFIDPAAGGISLDATRVRGSHGAPAKTDSQRGLIVASEKGVLVGEALADTDVFDLVLRQYGI